MESVLVVEDSRPMQQALRRIFSSDALEVTVAADGIAAVELFRAQTPNAVVLDLRLPGKSGKELCREFKALAPKVPIVVVSANADIDDKVLLLELGADDYVTKPFSPKELLARVRRAMRRADAAGVTPVADPTRHNVLVFSDVRVDFSAMEASKAGKPVTLTAQEFKVLKFFVGCPGGWFRARNCSTKSGVTSIILPRGRWTITFCGFGRNWRQIRPIRGFY